MSERSVGEATASQEDLHGVDEPADVEATVVVERRAGRRAATAATAEVPTTPAADDPDDTIVVAQRPAKEPEGTLVVDEKTAVVDRQASPRRAARGSRGAEQAQLVRISLPQGSAPSENAAEGPGPGRLDSYEPRPIPPPPTPGPALREGPEATRAEAPSMPSVRRANRRAAWILVGAIAAACVVSILGLVAIGFAVFGG